MYVPRESSLPIPSKCVDVVRQTTTGLDNSEESSIDDLWNMDGIEVLCESWIGS